MGKKIATLSCCLALTVVSSAASATTGIESPDNGVSQMSRGGAWLARADDPLAAFFNPAALVTQTSSVHLGAHLMFRSFCFDRRGPDGERLSPGGGLAAPPDEVCADNPPFPNPQLAGAWRLHKRWAVGLTVMGPHQNGAFEWPDTIIYDDRFGETPHPSPNRYLILQNKTFALFPALSGAFAITRQLSIGAGFVWGVVALDFSNMSEASSPVRGDPQPDDFGNDVRAQITGTDAIVPGFVASVQWSPSRNFDVAAWYHWSDAVRAKVDLFTQSNYFAAGGAVAEANLDNPAFVTDVKEAGTLKLSLPMEARIGVRYHVPRGGQPRLQKWVAKHHGAARDPLAEDLFDIELDLTWSHNSQIDKIEVRMQPGIAINGTPGFVPENADQERHWRDVLGARLGGEYVIIPDFIAARLGGFFESKGARDENLSLDFHQGEKIGVAGGAAVRLSRFDISLGYQHTFFMDLDNGGNGELKAVSGDATTGDFRTRQAVNGGSISSSLDEIALGATVHF